MLYEVITARDDPGRSVRGWERGFLPENVVRDHVRPSLGNIHVVEVLRVALSNPQAGRLSDNFV